jgi:hypothetical protein
MYLLRLIAGIAFAGLLIPVRAATGVVPALHGAPPATQILFRARVLPAGDPLLQGARIPAGPFGKMTATLKGPVHRIIVDLNVDAHGLVYEDTPDGAHHAKIEATLLAFDSEGKRVNYLDQGFQVNLNSEKYPKIMADGLPIRLALDLPAGPASLRIAVHDLNAERAGSFEVPLPDAAR